MLEEVFICMGDFGDSHTMHMGEINNWNLHI